MGESVTGILEIVPKGFGFLRSVTNDIGIAPTDPYLSPKLIQTNWLKTGMEVTGTGKALKNQPNISLESIESINGRSPDEIKKRVPFPKLTAIDPNEQLILETDQNTVSTRIIDLLIPIGKGQRFLIVSPPKAGKTTIMEEMAMGMKKNYPDMAQIIYLADERPEESTHFKRLIGGEVIATDFDKPNKEHIRVAHLIFERVKSLVESGRDVVLMIDSLTRLGRAFNRDMDNRGKTMTGGLSTGALDFPRKIFGSARNVDGGGSLTIIASILVDTGSKMDELIFQEFKGTGNSELVLERSLADLRIFPAMNFQKSGTRKEEKLLDPEILAKATLLRRAMLDDRRGEKYKMFLDKFKESASNREFLETIPLPTAAKRR
ncbi:MAG: transcription termination factor Rho [Nitrospinota bacterium]|nr:transcription termination factor Rho [Nitrospinota bacterium]